MIKAWLQRRREENRLKRWRDGYNWGRRMVVENGAPVAHVYACIAASHESRDFIKGAMVFLSDHR